MKYIDEKRMRLGYIGIFAAAVLLVGGAFWDARYNGEALLNWFLSGLGGLLLIAIFFFIATELILRDALDLRPRRMAVAMDEDHGAVPGNYQMSNKVATAVPPIPTSSTQSVTMMERPTMSQRMSHAKATSEWHPNVQPAATAPARIEAPTKVEPATPKLEPKKEIIRIELPAQVEIDAPAKAAPESPRTIPKPHKVQPAPHGVAVQELNYELGNAQFRVPRGSKGHRNPHAVLESARILCGDCGLYFRVDLDRARPMSVQCPQCSKDLGLSGARASAEHVKMRCRFCGDFLQMPRVAEHKSTQCATCGQING